MKSIPSANSATCASSSSTVVPLNTAKRALGKVTPRRRSVSAAILEIAMQCALARIEIERGDLRALIGQRDGDVDGSGRFAGAALFIGEDDTMWADMR
jgi:hypothetical protein